MEPMVKECHEFILTMSDLPSDKAIPKFQKALSEIAKRYNTTGDKVFEKYMDWKSSQEK